MCVIHENETQTNTSFATTKLVDSGENRVGRRTLEKKAVARLNLTLTDPAQNVAWNGSAMILASPDGKRHLSVNGGEYRQLTESDASSILAAYDASDEPWNNDRFIDLVNTIYGFYAPIG